MDQLVSAGIQCHYLFIAMDDATSHANRPASGSCDDHVLYGGSRRLKHRYEYGVNFKIAFWPRLCQRLRGLRESRHCEDEHRQDSRSSW